MKVRLQNGEVCFLRDSGERTVSEDSVATCSATWFCYPYSAASANSPIINKSVHPIWNGLYCKSVSIKKYGDGALITAQYEGAESWSSTSDQIESHPNFESWAGTPQKPNCGIFDEDGKFTGWNSKTEGGKIMAGVKSYLVPSYSGTVSYISKGGTESRRHRKNRRWRRIAVCWRNVPMDVHRDFLPEYVGRQLQGFGNLPSKRSKRVEQIYIQLTLI